jgi:hypothetical protein
MDKQERMNKENITLGTERYKNIDTPYIIVTARCFLGC